MKKIFFAAYGGGHINLLIPVIKEVLNKHDYEVIVLGLSIAKNNLKSAGIKFKTLSNYYNKILKDEVSEKYGKKMADKYHIKDKGLTYNETKIYYGISMRDLILKYGISESEKIFEKYNRKIFLPINSMKKILKYEKPDLIVTTNVPRCERALTLAGKKLGISTLNIDDFLGFEKRDRVEGDKIAVMCKITQENYIKKGYDKNKIIITGQPAFDSICDEMKNYKKPKIKKELNIKKNEKIILFATQGDSTIRQLEKIIKVCSEKQNYSLIIKPHPGEDITEIKKIINKFSDLKLKLIVDYNIRKLIIVSDIVLTFYSTVGFEAVLMKRPLIQVNLEKKKNLIPLYTFGVAEEARNIKDLKKYLNEFMDKTGKLYKKFLNNRKKYFKINNNSAKNISVLIKKMLEDN